MSFWNTATQEQKLAQIDGGLELGLTANQVAINCGVKPFTLTAFARFHGRSFRTVNGTQNYGARGFLRKVEASTCDAEKRISARTGTLGAAAFSIFDNHSEAFELEWPA